MKSVYEAARTKTSRRVADGITEYIFRYSVIPLFSCTVMLYQNRQHSAQGLDVLPHAGRLRHTGRSQFLGDGGIHA